MSYAIGIDLGTTNTVAAVVRDGVVATLHGLGGSPLLPSVVSFEPSGTVHVGRRAVDRRLMDPTGTIYSVKRLIGRAWGSPEVEIARRSLPFALSEGVQNGTVVTVRGESYALPEISAFVLRHVKAMAEATIGAPVERAVITVPANFNDLQRGATKTAGRIAGLEVLRILNEPTAAALAYGPQGKAQERIAVYDLGGGTFDVTILDLAGNVFEVLATAGDTALGGDDIDVLVADRMADDLLKKHRFDARAQPMVFGRLRILGEQMKRELSLRDAHTVAADDIVPGDHGSTLPWTFRMTRPELEWASLALVERTFRVCQQALEAAGAEPTQLDRVILVGGATRMPMVARKVEQFFGRAPVMRINPDEVVALGAAIQAALLDRSRQRVEGSIAHPLISEESIVGPAHEETAIEGAPILPVVTGKRPPPLTSVRPPTLQPPPAPSLPPAAAPSAVPQPLPEPPRAEFLPGAARKTLVFDVPKANAGPMLELPAPTAAERAQAAATLAGHTAMWPHGGPAVAGRRSARAERCRPATPRRAAAPLRARAAAPRARGPAAPARAAAHRRDAAEPRRRDRGRLLRHAARGEHAHPVRPHAHVLAGEGRADDRAGARRARGAQRVRGQHVPGRARAVGPGGRAARRDADRGDVRDRRRRHPQRPRARREDGAADGRAHPARRRRGRRA